MAELESIPTIRGGRVTPYATPPSGIVIDDLELPGLEALARSHDGLVSAQALWPVLESLSGADLLDRERLELVEAWRRLGSACDARRLQAMADFAATEVGGSRSASHVREFVDDEVALRVNGSRRTIGRELGTALALGGRLIATRRALQTGAIDLQRAHVIAEGCRDLGPRQAQQVESLVLDRAPQQSAQTLARAVARQVVAVAPEAATQRRSAARADRSVRGYPTRDGMAELVAHLPALDWVIISTAINAAARSVKASGDERSLEQLRADALVAPFAKALRTGVLDGLDPVTLARHRGVRPAVHVHVPAATLMGVEPAPGELTGYGAIDAGLARDLAADGVWQRLLTDPTTGAILDVGMTSYEPPASLARYVEARDRSCRFPGCAVPAERCDLDHLVPFPIGTTEANNLNALCRRHHRLKHELKGTRVSRAPDGTLSWTLPTGRFYSDAPDGFGDSSTSDPRA
jgi:hypothetical protein